MALEHKEDLLDLVRVGSIALSGRHEHDREGEVFGWNGTDIAVFSRTAGADESMLGAFVAFNLGVLERRPVGFTVSKARSVAIHDLLQRYADQLLRKRMSSNAHGSCLSISNMFGLLR